MEGTWRPIKWRIQMANLNNTAVLAQAPVRGRGRPLALAHTIEVVDALNNLEGLSRYLALRLKYNGLVAVEKVAHAGRGRQGHRYVLTGKGRGLVALARNWKRPVAEVQNVEV
jgi:hypothetical protein